MSSSRTRRSSRRTFIVAAAVLAATVVAASAGIRTLSRSGSFVRACEAVAADRGNPLRMSVIFRTDGRERHCAVMLAPVVVDSGSAGAAVHPRLSNVDEVFDALTRSIPGEDGETGAGGVAVAHFLVDETGVARQRRIAEPSGSETLDEALLTVGSLARFSPVETEDGPTEAWVALTVGFRTRQSGL